jgi:predicted Zn-dependent protease
MKRTTALMLSLLVIVFIIAPSQRLPDARQSDPITPKQELEQEVWKLIKANDDTGLRHEIEKVFTLAQLYADEGDVDRALKVYGAGLRADANNLENQLKYAKLLLKADRRPDAISAARIVFDMAETEFLINESETFLKHAGLNTQVSPSHTSSKGIQIAIVPLGNPNPRIVTAISRLLEEKMGIEFPVLPGTVLGTPEWDRSREFVRNYMDWIKGRVSADQFEQIKIELGFRSENLDSFEARKRFLYAFFDKVGPQGREMKKQFEETLLKMSKIGVYEIPSILSKLKQAHPLVGTNKIKGYLAITDKGICEGEDKWRFGGAWPGYAVVSYSRFTADFTQEPQNRPRLITRTLKQSLSSANFILDIPRCTNPNCVRAYPHSLDELDKKPVELCPVCQNALDQHKGKLRL